jgi:signal transduction histidine kinase
MHADGATFRFLWPGAPHWNAFASLPLGLALNITAGFFTRAFLNTAEVYPRIDKAFLAVIAVSALTIVAGLAFEREARILAFPLVLIAALTYLFGGVRALRDGAPGALYYVIGWTAISAAALFASVVNTPFATNYITFDLVRASMIIDGLMMALALMAQVSVVRAERDELLRRELAVMRANLDMVDRINALERRQALAESAAAARGRTLTSAFHDMRQPLLSLRLAVQRLAEEPAAAGDAAQLEASLSYLEELAETLLAESLARDPAGGKEGGQENKSSVETFDAQLVLDALEQMFARDARHKGLRFVCVGTKAALRAQPIVLLRILSNLTANAVKHTTDGGVVIGCRKRGERVWLCVYDTGRGLSPEKRERAPEPSRRHAAKGEAGGFGLGLSIVARLAAEHGFLIESRSAPGVGTSFAVGVLPAS